MIDTAQVEREPTGKYPFDQTCRVHSIKHRLTSSYPQTNGMVERFDGRIAELIKSAHFCSAQELTMTLRH